MGAVGKDAQDGVGTFVTFVKWLIGGVSVGVDEVVGVATEKFEFVDAVGGPAAAVPVDDAVVGMLFVGHLDDLGGGALDLHVVGDIGTVFVEVMEHDDGCTVTGELSDWVEKFADGDGVLDSFASEAGVETVDNDEAFVAFGGGVVDLPAKLLESGGDIEGDGSRVDDEVVTVEAFEVGLSEHGELGFVFLVAEVVDDTVVGFDGAEGDARGEGVSEGEGDGRFTDFGFSREDGEGFVGKESGAIGGYLEGFDEVDEVHKWHVVGRRVGEELSTSGSFGKLRNKDRAIWAELR